MTEPTDAHPVIEPPPAGAQLPRWLRRVRLVRRIGYVVALVFFLRFAHTRWTTPPAGGTASAAARESGDRVTQQFKILFAVPPIQSGSTSVVMPSSYGSSAEASPFVDPWNPTQQKAQANAVERYFVPAVADYTAQALKIANALEPGVSPRRLDWNEYEWSMWGGATNQILPHQIPIDYLLLKARVQIEGNDDPAGFEHFVAAIRLARVLDLLLPHAYGIERTETLVLTELSLQLRRAALPRTLAHDLIAILQQRDGFSLTAELRRNFFAGASEDLLDRFYTRGDDDDGWLVLSSCGNTLGISYWQMVYGGQQTPRLRSRAWNLLSPLFYSRSEARQNLGGGNDWVSQADALPLAEILQRAEVSFSVADKTIRDGPLLFVNSENSNHGIDITTPTAIVSLRRSAAIIAALAAYSAENGGYPTTLAELQPDFLEEIPLDPYEVQPLNYQLDDELGFELRSEDFTAQLSPRPAYLYDRSISAYGTSFSVLDRAPVRPTLEEVLARESEDCECPSEESEE